MMAHLASLGLRAMYSPAIFPEGDYPWSEAYDATGRMRSAGHALRRGQVGSFLAHREAWKTALHSGEVCLILEDDARLPVERLGEIAAAANHIRGRRMLVRLFSSRRGRFRPWRELPDGTCLGLSAEPDDSAVAYLVTAQAVVNLLGESESFAWPVDEFLNMRYRHDVTVLRMEPLLATHDGELPSGVGLPAQVSLTRWSRIRSRCIAFWSWLRLRAAVERAAWRLGLGFRYTQKPRTGR